MGSLRPPSLGFYSVHFLDSKVSLQVFCSSSGLNLLSFLVCVWCKLEPWRVSQLVDHYTVFLLHVIFVFLLLP